MHTPNGTAGPEAAPLQCWNEWRELCALGRCAESSRHYLQHFAHRRFRTLVDRYAHRTGVEEARALTSTIGPRESWHLLETRFLVNSSIHGKRYKDWLFARLEPSPSSALDVIQGGATLILRDAVREYLRLEFPPPRTQSLSRPLQDGAGDPVTLEDLLPDEYDVADQAAHREYVELAEKHAATFFDATDERDRIALLARGLGISFAAPQIEKMAGRRKSVMSQAYRSCVARLASEIQRSYPGEDSASLLMLSRLTLETVTDRVLRWAKSEKRFAPFFLSIEGAADVE